MMESLIAFCVVLLIAAGVIVALGMAVECLRRLACRRSPAPAGSHWTPSSTTRDPDRPAPAQGAGQTTTANG
jgi:hypothetical protein